MSLTGTHRDSLFLNAIPGVITGASQANPCNIEDIGHGLLTGDQIRITDVIVGSMVGLNDINYTITKVDNDNYTLDGINSTLFTVYTSGGQTDKLLGSAADFPQGNLEGQIPLLGSGGTFDPARIPGSAIQGLTPHLAEIDLSSGSPTSVSFTGIAATVQRMQLVVYQFDALDALGTSYHLGVQLGHGGGPTYLTSGYGNSDNAVAVVNSEFIVLGGTIDWKILQRAGLANPPPISAIINFTKRTGNVWIASGNSGVSLLGGELTMPAAVSAMRLSAFRDGLTASTMTGFVKLYTNA